MGAWGAGSFDNEIASSWAEDLLDGGDLDMVRDTLTTAAKCPPDEYLESDEASEAIAAAEVVAAAMGRPVKTIEMGTAGPHAVHWGKTHPGAGKEELVELALEAIDRIEADESELQEIWDAEESPGAGMSSREWHSEVEDLRNRLLAG